MQDFLGNAGERISKIARRLKYHEQYAWVGTGHVSRSVYYSRRCGEFVESVNC